MMQETRWQRVSREVDRIVNEIVSRRVNERSNIRTISRRQIATRRHHDARNFILRHTRSQRAVAKIQNALPNIAPVPGYPCFKGEAREIGNQVAAEVHKRRVISI